jgi:1-acyl-sn-glycerol-3-phosphate acyltransferase
MNKLTSQNNYQTPERSISWIARMAPTLVFHTKNIGCVVNAARLSKSGKYGGREWAQSSLDITRALESVGVIINVENLHAFRDISGPCVFIANHMSTLETFVLPCLIRPYRRVTFVVKESLITYPFFKHVMISRNPIVVGRSNPREDLRMVLEQGEQRLKNNISVVVFPQTTRIVKFDEKHFNSMGVKLARRGNVPVVPVTLKTDAWGVGKRIKDFGKIDPSKPVRFAFGNPIDVAGSGKETHQIVIAFIKGKLASWA